MNHAHTLEHAPTAAAAGDHVKTLSHASTPASHDHPHHPPLGPLSLELKAVTLTLVLLPLLGIAAVVALSWSVLFQWLYVALLIGLYLATGLGITVGFHRLFTHRSFTAGPVVTFVLAALGSMAVQGPIIEWVAVHRRHHQHSDGHQDPHSPATHGDGLSGLLKGFWHAHMGWFIRPSWVGPESTTGGGTAGGIARYVPDLYKDRVIEHVNRWYPLWVVVGMVIPAAIGLAVTQTWMGGLLGFLWGGLIRVFMVHHITWSINSVCHIWGSRPFKSDDESRNNTIFGWLAFGEGWHNNHHAFPTSARHGLFWWQFDATYVLIWLMAMVGLAKDVKVPSAERIEAKRQREA